MENKLKIETLSCQIQINFNEIYGSHRPYVIDIDTAAAILNSGMPIPDTNITIQGLYTNSFFAEPLKLSDPQALYIIRQISKPLSFN